MNPSTHLALCLALAGTFAAGVGCAKKEEPAAAPVLAPPPAGPRPPAPNASSGAAPASSGAVQSPQVPPPAPGEVRATDMLSAQRMPEARQRLAKQAGATDEQLAKTEQAMRVAAGESPAPEIPETPQQLDDLRMAAFQLRRSTLEGNAAGVEAGTARLQALMQAMPLSKAGVTREYVKAMLTLDLGVVHPVWGKPAPVPTGPLGLPQNDPPPAPAPFIPTTAP